MIEVQDAIQKVLQASLNRYKTTKTLLKDTVGLILAEDIYSPIAMPPFAQSAMDGYAVCFGKENVYTVVEEIQAGDNKKPVLNEGEAVRIFTGAPVPPTADAVAMQEKTTVEGNRLTVLQELTKGFNIRPEGEQIKTGDLGLEKGTVLKAGTIGFLATLGIQEVLVYQKPTVAVVVTGNELVKAGQELAYGQIYDSNSIMLQTALKEEGVVDPVVLYAKDEFETTKQVLDKALTDFDIVLVSGGISVGDYDYVGKALLDLGVQEEFYKVKQKPGKPLFFGTKGDKVVFALPGNPAASLTCFYIYALPFIRSVSGRKIVELEQGVASLSEELTKKGDRAQFYKANVEHGVASILKGQSSAMLKSFGIANAFVFVDSKTNQISVGEKIKVIFLPL